MQVFRLIASDDVSKQVPEGAARRISKLRKTSLVVKASRFQQRAHGRRQALQLCRPEQRNGLELENVGTEIQGQVGQQESFSPGKLF